MWNFSSQIDHKLKHNKPDIAIVDKEKKIMPYN